jgi:hypothetical protein
MTPLLTRDPQTRLLLETELQGHLKLAHAAKGLQARPDKAYHLEQARALGQVLGWNTRAIRAQH